MEKTFHTPGPVSLFVELRSGDLVVTTADTEETVVEVTSGKGAGGDDVTVDQHGDEIRVVARHGGGGLFGSSSPRVSVAVRLPHESRLTTKMGSADVRVDGRLGEALLRSGSGDLRIDAVSGKASVETGSGDVAAGTVGGDLQVKSGSGDIAVERVGGSAQVSTGSGDVVVGTSEQPVAVKSGSGDLRVREAGDDVALSTASGDLLVDRMLRGRLNAKNASGDITVGIPAGVPVWTDVSTVTGSVRSTLQGAGEPAEDQDFIELRARTVSGDITFEQL